MRSLLIMLAAGLSVAATGLPVAAQAAAVPNDSFASATAVTSLPFSTAEDTSQATWDASDPSGCSNNGSVWFSFTPASDMTIAAGTSGNYDTVLSAWTGTQQSLTMAACSAQGPVTLAVTAGTTYYFMVAACCGNGGDGGGDLRFTVSQLLPPGNDNFASATAIGTLPFSDTQDLRVATVEPAEPDPGCFSTAGSEWYSFTAPAAESFTASVDWPSYGLAAYTGNSLAGLSRIGCSPFSPVLTFRAQAGVTYYFQIGLSGCCWPGPATFSLTVAPNPTAALFFNPIDPSSFDTIQFSDDSFDSADVGISSWAWDLGDGTASTLRSPTHRYAADGDYTVHLTVTTGDGRTNTTSRVVQVRTHDVAITRLAVPSSAHAGQTIAINAYVRNTRYPETVEVGLSKSIPGGFAPAGSLTEPVPARAAGHATRFAFSYTVTRDDVAAGKITFRADASITGYRDALPADNELLSAPVKAS